MTKSKKAEANTIILGMEPEDVRKWLIDNGFEDIDSSMEGCCYRRGELTVWFVPSCALWPDFLHIFSDRCGLSLSVPFSEMHLANGKWLRWYGRYGACPNEIIPLKDWQEANEPAEEEGDDR